jgi:hypothetical protein
MRKYVLWTIVAMLAIAVPSYLMRGYFAFGIEVFFPMIAFIMYKGKRATR